jgi:hypothetical protein
MERDKEGNFFIDQPFAVFELMVNYLRAKACQTPNAPPLRSPDFEIITSVAKEDFLRMVEYYGMMLGLHPIKLVSGIPGKVEYRDDLSIDATEWATFAIEGQGHDLIIKSFDVTMHQVERAQIGWRHNHFSTEEFQGTIGVGEIANTVALDCCRSVMLVEGVLLPIDRRCKEGSTIRCEEGGKRWYIDGRLIASMYQSDKDVPHLFAHTTGQYALPTISAKGSFTVSNVEYHLLQA